MGTGGKSKKRAGVLPCPGGLGWAEIYYKLITS
jgi:hypothetical protein